ncbi:MAG: T9SS type A sorting domain-containing protein [Bacteroidetes bacterium]|nr:T9SS type A sorting domain-containing protein [Bacteroidota bacterium]
MKKNYFNSSKKVTHTIYRKISHLFLFFAVLFASKNSISQTYCAAAATSTSDEEIFNVTFGTLNNSSTCGTTGGSGSVLNMYSNYTGLTPQVYTLGSNYPLSVTVGQCGTSSYSGIVGVWIDYNQNGSFADPGENIITSPYTLFAVAGTVLSAPTGITIPFTATPGTTRMRIIATESSTAPGPCTNPTWGEVEDYNITILSPSPLDLGVSALINPLTSKRCYAVDTIVARVKNFGSATADFSVNSTTVTVNTTGPNAGTYTLALSSGTIASNASQDFTMTTTYNLSNIGTYKLKAYTTVVGDGSVLNDTTSLTVTRSPIFITSALPNDSVCLGVPVQLNAAFSSTKQLGTGILENTSTSYPAPYGNFYEGAKHQFLFLASELTAAGLVAGNINSLAFNATNLNGTDPLTNYNVAIATTTLTNITAFQTTGFTTYFSSASYVPVLGANTHTFSTPYVWDGVSNLIVETCFNNTPAGYSNNVSVTQSSTPFSSTVWYNADANATLCSQTTTSGSMNQRPNIAFEQPATITYTWSPAIELSAANISNPIANVTSTRTYTITGLTSGCMTYDTVQIFVKPTPTPNLGNDTLFCSLPVVLNANTTANSFLWNNASIGSSLNITTPGKYWVRGTNTNGCSNTDTIQVGLGSSPIVTLGPDTAFCQGSNLHLYAGVGTGNVYTWNTGATTSSISVNSPGTYSVVVTNTIGCQSSDIISITSKAKPSVSLVFTGLTTFCKDDNTVKVLTEGSPSGGTYIGAAVSTNTFSANQAGQGSHIILYTITGSNGCSNTAKDTLTVNACVGIEELTNDMNINVYPNPTTGIFTLDLTTSSDLKGILYITSIDGKVVLNDVIEGNGLISKSINISDLANGIYYLKLETKDAIKTYKVIKQ